MLHISLPGKISEYTLTGHFIRYLFNCLVTQIANQSITWQQLNAFRYLDVVRKTCWSSNRSSEWGRKGIKVTLNRMVVGARRLVFQKLVFQKLLIYWDFHAQPSLGFTENGQKQKISSKQQLCGWKCLVDVRGQRRMGRLVRDDRKATVTQITTHYNQGMQNTISEHTTHRTLKQMGYSSRRPHRVPLLSAKNRKQRLQFTQAHQHWTIEDWKNVA